MKEFYIHERYLVKNVEAVRIIPIDASQIEMRKEQWGAVINGHEFYGHIEIRTMLGNLVDSHAGIYADTVIWKDIKLERKGYELIQIYTPEIDAKFIYVQYMNADTQEPLLVKYRPAGESSIVINEGEIERWCCDTPITYEHIKGDYNTLYEKSMVPKLKGGYIEVSCIDGAVFIPVYQPLPVRLVFGDEGLGVTYPIFQGNATLTLDKGIITYQGILKDGTQQGSFCWDTEGEAILDHFNSDLWIDGAAFGIVESQDKSPFVGIVISGVKAIINLK